MQIKGKKRDIGNAETVREKSSRDRGKVQKDTELLLNGRSKSSMAWSKYSTPKLMKTKDSQDLMIWFI